MFQHMNGMKWTIPSNMNGIDQKSVYDESRAVLN